MYLTNIPQHLLSDAARTQRHLADDWWRIPDGRVQSKCETSEDECSKSSKVKVQIYLLLITTDLGKLTIRLNPHGSQSLLKPATTDPFCKQSI